MLERFCTSTAWLWFSVALVGLAHAQSPTPTAPRVAAIGVASVSCTPAPTPNFAALPLDTWTRITTSSCQRYIGLNFIDCTQTKWLTNPVGRQYTGTAFGNNGIFMMGGGHAGHPGNDIELYDIATNTWRQQFQPDCPPACCVNHCSATLSASCSVNGDCPSGETCVLHTCAVGDPDDNPACHIGGGPGSKNVVPSDGLPYVEHMYQRHAWNPTKGHFVDAHSDGVFAFDPAVGGKGGYTILTNTDSATPVVVPSPGATPLPYGSNSINSHVLFYDPDLATVVWVHNMGSPDWKAWKLNYTTRSWDVLPGTLTVSGSNGSDINEGYDPVGHRHLISITPVAAGSSRSFLYWYVPAMGTWTAVTNAPDEVVSDVGLGACSSCFGPENITFNTKASLMEIGFTGADGTLQMWGWDMANTWGRLALSGAPTTTGSGFGRFGNLWYDSAHDVTWFVNTVAGGSAGHGGINEGDVETWVVRTSGAVAGAPTPKPINTPSLTSAGPAPTPGVFYAYGLPGDDTAPRSGGKHAHYVLNPDNGRLYVGGGDWNGHCTGVNCISNAAGNSYRNETYSFSTLDQSWRRETDYCQGTKPQPKHPDLSGWIWDSTRHVFWMQGGLSEDDAKYPGDGECTSPNYYLATLSRVTAPNDDQNHWPKAWMAFDPVGKVWTPHTERTSMMDAITLGLLDSQVNPARQETAWYDPVRDEMDWFCEVHARSCVLRYNFTGNVWSVVRFLTGNAQVDDATLAGSAAEGAAFDPDTRRVYAIDGRQKCQAGTYKSCTTNADCDGGAQCSGTLYRLWLDRVDTTPSSAFEKIEALPVGVQAWAVQPPGPGGGETRVAWDPIHHVMFYAEFGGQGTDPAKFKMHVYHPDTNAWEINIPLTRNPPATPDPTNCVAGGSGDCNMVYGNELAFDYINNVLMLRGGSGPNNPYTYLFRYAPGSLPATPPPAPARPTPPTLL